MESSCSWCHTINPIFQRWCRKCGHDAHAARMYCQCPRCSSGRNGDDPVDSLPQEGEEEE
jgi:hypothetical protein